MKRLVICCDGTWQQLSSSYPTNVVKIAQAVKPIAQDGISQIVYYGEGIGTTSGELDKLTGGAFGWGIDQSIKNAYRFLCLNYVEGDEIYLFGFSRGAYTVRSLAGFIYCSGLLNRQQISHIPEAYELYRDRKSYPSDSASKEFRSKYGENVPITVLGCWDTVGELGVPDQIPLLPIDDWINAKYKFHDTQLNRKIQNAFHAVAMDERSKAFDVTRMRVSDNAATKLSQVWFPGTHGCVGGGTEDLRGLSDGALQWMMERTKQVGLDFDPTLVELGVEPDYSTLFSSKVDAIYKLAGVISRQILDPKDASAKFDRAFFDDSIDLSTKQRWKLANANYRPENLIPYDKWFDAFAEVNELAQAR